MASVRLNGGGAFLHVPKTGGSWVTEVLRASGICGPALGHEHGWEHDEPWAFCVLRHPVDWYRSHWAYQRQKKWKMWGGRSHPLNEILVIKNEDFGGFVRECIDEAPGFLARMYARFAERGEVVLRQETLRADLAGLGGSRGWALNLGAVPAAVNATHAREEICEDLRRELLCAEAWALELWEQASLTRGTG